MFLEAFGNSYSGRHNVELSTGKIDSSIIKSVVPRKLLVIDGRCGTERELVALRYKKETTAVLGCLANLAICRHGATQSGRRSGARRSRGRRGRHVRRGR